MKHGRRYEGAVALVDREEHYAPPEGVALAKKAATAKFDETVEMHVRLNVDTRQGEQQVRGVALLPHGLGKRVRVLVFAQGEVERQAQEAGADFVGGEELARRIQQENWLEFDVALATPDMMRVVTPLGRILGPRGLMPNPRTGTVVQPVDIPRVVEEARKGRVEFRADKTGIVHAPIGKISFSEQQILENMAQFMDAVVRARPSGVKGQFVRSITLTTSMGPGIKLDVGPTSALKPSE
ncbi:MAG: 50S ribosomal protein L1 [Chloroflexi bacterium]|nr:50S ribosomal protein L1 [Chloroflexota bacterium]